MATRTSHSNGGIVFGIFLAVGVLFILACFLPCIDGGPEVVSSDPGFPDFESGWHFGLEILLFGWGGGNNGVPWAANVFLAFGLVCLWSRWLRLAAVQGFIASLLGLTTWWARRYDTMMVGYYFWQASQLVLAGGALWAARSSMQQTARMVRPQVTGYKIAEPSGADRPRD